MKDVYKNRNVNMIMIKKKCDTMKNRRYLEKKLRKKT